MKKYLKYKYFIPKEFIEKKQLKENEENKKGYKLLVCINIILLFFNIEVIFNKRESYESVPEVQGKYIEKDEIIKWINLYDEESIGFKVINNFAEITYEKNKDVQEIESLGVKIKKITNNDDKKVVKVVYE